jgi:integrase
MRRVANPLGKHGRKRRHHGEGSVVRRKDHWRAKPWVAVVPWTDDRGVRREAWLSAASREEAEDLLKHELVKRARTRPTDHTVGSYVIDWLATADLSPSARDRYRQHIEARILPTLGDVHLEDVTPPMIRRAMQRWSGAPATRHGTLIVLRMAMRQALADRMVPDDPMAGVKAPTLRHAPPTILDADDARRLIGLVRDERFAPLLVVSLGLGLRRGELLGLRTPDVDLMADTLTVSHSLRRLPTRARMTEDDRWRLVAPKADSGRVIPLPRFVAEALERRIAERDQEKAAAKVWAPNDLVFSDRNGNPIAYTSLDHWWKGALARAGLPDMRWHELRASTATILLAEGVDPLTIAAILGHTDIAMTQRYVKLLPRVSRAAADRMNEVVG